MRPGMGKLVCGRGLQISCLVWLSLCFTIVTFATTLRRMELQEMVAVADRVVHARVVGSRVYWGAPGQILTDTTFEVLSDVKGSGPRTLMVTQLGGRIDPVELYVEGTPAFSMSEEVVLFTEPTPGGKRVIVGLSQGVIRIHADPGSGEKTAFGEVTPGSVTFVGGHPHPVAAPLETLLEDLRRMSAAGTGRGGMEETPVSSVNEEEGGEP